MVRPVYDLAELTQLPVAERLKLLEALWESLRPEPAAAELTFAELALLDERIREADEHPERAIPWEQARAQLWANQRAAERDAAGPPDARRSGKMAADPERGE